MTKEWLTQADIDEHIRRRVADQLSRDIAAYDGSPVAAKGLPFVPHWNARHGPAINVSSVGMIRRQATKRPRRYRRRRCDELIESGLSKSARPQELEDDVRRRWQVRFRPHRSRTYATNQFVGPTASIS